LALEESDGMADQLGERKEITTADVVPQLRHMPIAT
jgi:hypothetical protein